MATGGAQWRTTKGRKRVAVTKDGKILGNHPGVKVEELASISTLPAYASTNAKPQVFARLESAARSAHKEIEVLQEQWRVLEQQAQTIRGRRRKLRGTDLDEIRGIEQKQLALGFIWGSRREPSINRGPAYAALDKWRRATFRRDMYVYTGRIP